MKKLIISLLALFLVVGAVSALEIISTTQEIRELFEQEQQDNFGATWTGEAVNSATTTQTALPVMILDYNQARESAVIINDSDTVIYLHLGYFENASNASSSVKINQGIRLNASGGSYEINKSNLYKNQVWATSTASSKNIIYSEF